MRSGKTAEPPIATTKIKAAEAIAMPGPLFPMILNIAEIAITALEKDKLYKFVQFSYKNVLLY